jgi:hypothetical protein
MWEPRPLTALWAFTACYRDSFTFFFFLPTICVCACQFIAITREGATLISVQSKKKCLRPLFPSAGNALTFSSHRHNDTRFSQTVIKTAIGVILYKTVLLNIVA